MSGEIDQATAKLSEFEKAKSIDQLQQAVEAMERVLHPGAATATGVAAARQQQARMWLRLLAAMEQSLDPKFDPDDVPEVKAIPPLSREGEQLHAMADARAIRDPAARAQHEKILKTNREKAERYRFQTRLRRIEPHIWADVEGYFGRFYTSSRADRKEVDGLLKSVTLSAARKEKLRAIPAKKQPSE